MEQKPLSDLTDEALCQSAARGNPQAESELTVRYGRLVRACARPLFLAGGDGEDLIQEGMMGLLTAIRTFDPGRDATFRTYAEPPADRHPRGPGRQACTVEPQCFL